MVTHRITWCLLSQLHLSSPTPKFELSLRLLSTAIYFLVFHYSLWRPPSAQSSSLWMLPKLKFIHLDPTRLLCQFICLLISVIPFGLSYQLVKVYFIWQYALFILFCPSPAFKDPLYVDPMQSISVLLWSFIFPVCVQ